MSNPDELEYPDPQGAGSEEDKADEKPFVFPLEHKPGNSITTHEHVHADKVFNPDNFTFYLPSYSLNYTTQLLRKADVTPGINRKDPEIEDWARRQKESTQYFTPGGLYQRRFEEADSCFEQGIRHPDGRLRSITPPKFKSAADNTLRGDMAVLKVSKALGLGEPNFVPLPHSGLVVTMNPPTETDLIDFYGSLFREKIYLGRMSAGMTLSNMSSYINSRLFDFIIKHISAVNYGEIEPAQLRNYMLIHDLPILAWGFACCMYPNGFDFSRSCSFDLSQCRHVEKGVINLLYLLRVDNKALTDFQRETLYEARANSLTMDTYQKYISEHTRVKTSTINLGDNLTFKLKIPTVAEHFADGFAWINKINTAIDNVITVDLTEQEAEKARQEMLQQYVSASILRQFSHFVDSIESDGELIEGREDINRVLALLSSDDKLRAEITAKIVKFKVDTTIAMVGIDEYKCPSCGKPQHENEETSPFRSVIPIDAMMTFFTLVTLRISRIMERE